MSSFSPEDKPIDDLFARNITYSIPPYQRPYSWESIGKNDANNQVNKMWDDLYFAFTEAPEGEYFLGAMVVIEDSKRVYTVIDGQQRLTTLLLLFSAIKMFINRRKSSVADNSLKRQMDDFSTWLNDLIFNKERRSSSTPLKVKIEHSQGFDFNSVLTHAVNGEERNTLKDSNPKYQTTINRYFQNRDYFIEQLEKNFIYENDFTNNSYHRLSEFYDFILKYVYVIHIRANGFQKAFQVFETLNNRGLPLSNKDLFRNFIISKLGSEGSEFMEKIDRDYHLNDDFLLRWISCLTASRQRSSAFNDILDYFEKHYSDDKNINNFVVVLKEDLTSYDYLINEESIKDLQLRNKIMFIKALGNEKYNIPFLLSLLKATRPLGQSNPRTISILTIYQRLLLSMSLSSTKRFNPRPVYNSIDHLNNNRILEAKQELELNPKDFEQLKELISSDIRDTKAAKALLFMYDSSLNTERVNEGDPVVHKLLLSNATLEHIIPQNTQDNRDWLTFNEQEREHWCYKLGNMTLLSGKSNSKIKNHSLKKKISTYKISSILMTNEFLSDIRNNVDEFTIDFLHNRHKKITGTIFNELDIQQ